MEARISSSLLSDRSVQTWRQVLHTLQRVEFVGWFVGGARVVCLNSALYRLKNLRSLVSDRVLRLLCDALMGERSSRPSLLYLRVNLLSPSLELKDKIKYIRSKLGWAGSTHYVAFKNVRRVQRAVTK